MIFLAWIHLFCSGNAQNVSRTNTGTVSVEKRYVKPGNLLIGGHIAHILAFLKRFSPLYLLACLANFQEEIHLHVPGSGMCMPGRGTLNGGTMTGGNAGIAAAGWPTDRPGGRL